MSSGSLEHDPWHSRFSLYILLSVTAVEHDRRYFFKYILCLAKKMASSMRMLGILAVLVT